MTFKTNEVRFVLTQKEVAILDHVQATLGIGRVKTYASESGSRYIVSDKASIYILTTLFNGNLVLNKRKPQLKK